MDFGIENLTVQNGVASVDLATLTDDEYTAARKEFEAVGEAKGLWVPAGAGELVVATTIDAPTVEALSVRDQLLTTVEAGAKLYVATIDGINQKRAKKDQIPTLKVDEYIERATDWLTERREQATTHLPATDDRPRLLIPRLNRAISTEENLDVWSAASDRGLYPWAGRKKFLQNWTADELSGFDPSVEDEVTFEVLPTAYDQDREGTVADQTTALKELQADYPEIDVASIFNGVVLARRYKGQPRVWLDSYVRGITLKPARVDRDDCVPDAGVYGVGNAGVYGSGVQVDGAARLRVR